MDEANLPTEEAMRPGVEKAQRLVADVMASVRAMTEFERVLFCCAFNGRPLTVDYDKMARSPWGLAFARGERA